MQPSQIARDETLESSVEALVCQLVHDIRQPLSNIQSGAGYLGLVLRSASPGTLAQVEMIERQVEEADRMLARWLDQVRCALAQRAAAESRARTNSAAAVVT